MGVRTNNFGTGISRSCCSTLLGGLIVRMPERKNIFQGGFLGMDNIGVFDRSAELPTGGDLEQADGTSWMANSLDMLTIA